MKYRQIASMILLVILVFKVDVAIADTIPSEVKKVVTFIFLADAQGNLLRDEKTNNPIAYGTGFFVGVKSEDGSGTYGYLVTAKHVLKDSEGHDLNRVYLRLNKRQGDAEFVPLDLAKDGQRTVYTHPDASVDIAVVPALPPEATFDFKVIPDDMISTKATFDEFNVAEGSDVFFLGLFTTYYGEHKNNPIVRFGRVAMFPDDPIDWADYQGQPIQHAQLYLIETQSYGGNSGAPVFFSLGSDRSPKGGFILGSPVLKLAGIMKGRFNDVNPALGHLESPTASTVITLPSIGIAAVTPSYFLNEILFSDELKKFRADHPISPPMAK
jgi:hypothetical protein